MKNLSYINKYLYKYRFRLILGILFISVSNFFALMPAQVIRNVFDLIKENQNIYYLYKKQFFQENIYLIFTKMLLMFALIILALAALKGIFMFFMRQTIIVMSRLIEYDLKNEVYDHFQSLHVGFYKMHNTGDLMTRITEDIAKVRSYLGPAIMYSINLVVLFIIVISTMVYVNAKLTFYVLLPLPILSMAIYYISNIINKKSYVIQKQLSKLTTFCQEVFSGITIIKSYVQEENANKNFNAACINYKQKSLSLIKVEALFFPLMLLLIGLSTIFTIYVGGIQVIRGEITTGNIAEFVIYINMLTWPVTSIGWIASIIQQAEASQKRINEFLNIKPEIYSIKNKTINIQGNIKLHNVSFTYPDTGIEAIKNVSFEIKQGERVAIIGKTGSGKTTIADLILRIYDPSKGAILIDEVNIKDYNIESLRKQVAYAPQDAFLFSDTIANNIAWGLHELSHEEDMHKIKQSSKDAGVYTDIMKFRHKFNTLLGERGVTLSGGQKQRLTIARALIKSPKIILLDDCFSAIDLKTEKKILSNLDNMLNNKTAVIITHRILSLKNIDKTIVIDSGEIIEEGDHKTLLAKKGVYYTLYQKQQLEDNTIIIKK